MVTKMMGNMVAVGNPGHRIFVERGDQQFVVPYWISHKGNLCWRLGEVLYVKLKNGFVIMRQGDEWLPANATTKATIVTERKENHVS